MDRSLFTLFFSFRKGSAFEGDVPRDGGGSFAVELSMCPLVRAPRSFLGTEGGPYGAWQILKRVLTALHIIP